MPSLCDALDRAKGETKRLIARYAVAKAFEHFMESGDYYSAIRIAEQAAEKGVVGGATAEKMKAIASAIDALSEASSFAERMISDMKEGRVDEKEVLTARELSRRLKELAGRLSSLGLGKLASDLQEASESLSKLAVAAEGEAKLAEWVKRINDSLREGSEELGRGVELFSRGRLSDAWEHFRRAAEVFESAGKIAANPPILSGSLAEVAKRISEGVRGEALALNIAASRLADAVAAANQFLAFLRNLYERLKRGEVHGDIESSLISNFYLLMSTETELRAFAPVVAQLMSDALRKLGVKDYQEYGSRLGNLLERAADSLRELYLGIWNEVAPYNPVVHDAMEYAASMAGVSLPPIHQNFILRLEDAVGRAIAVGDSLAKIAGRKHGLDKLWYSLGSILAYVVSFVGSLPLIPVQGVLAHGAVLGKLLRGDVVGAAKTEWEILKGLVPPHRNWEQLAAFAIALAITYPLLKGRFGRVIEITYPEFLALGKGFELASRYLRPRLEEIAEVVPEKTVREYLVSFRSPSEFAERLGEEIALQLRENGVPESYAREYAGRLASLVYKYLSELREPGEIERALEEAAERYGIVEVDLALKKALRELPELEKNIAGELKKLAEEIVKPAEFREALESIERSVSERKLVEPGLYERIASVELRLADLSRMLEDLRRNLDILRDVMGAKEAEKLVDELEEARTSLERLRIALAKARRIEELVRVSKGDVEIAREMLYKVDPELAKSVREPSDILKAYGALLSYVLERLPAASRQVLDVLKGVRSVLLDLAKKYPEYYGRFAREIVAKDKAIAKAVRGRVLLEIPKELAEKYGLPSKVTVENLPEFLRRVRELGYPGELVKMLSEAENILRSMLARLELLRKAGVDVVEAVTGLSRELRSLEAAVKYYRGSIEPWREPLKTVAEALSKAGLRSLADRLERATSIDEALSVLRDALRKLGETGSRHILEVVASKIKDAAEKLRGREPGLYRALEALLADVRKMLESRVSAGKEVWGWLEAAVHKYRVIRASDADIARLIELARRGRESLTVEVGGRTYRITRELHIEPGRTEIVYRIEEPEGNWLEWRAAVRVTDRYAITEEAYKIDPEIRGNPGLVEELSRVLHDVAERDELADIARRIVVLTDRGPERLSAAIIPPPISYPDVVLNEEKEKLSGLAGLSVPIPPENVPVDIRDFFSRVSGGLPVHFYRIGDKLIAALPSISGIEGRLRWYRLSVDGISVDVPVINVSGVDVIVIPQQYFQVTVATKQLQKYRVSLKTVQAGGGRPSSPKVRMTPIPPPPLPGILGAGALATARRGAALFRRERLVF